MEKNNKLLIYGAGGAGREIAFALSLEKSSNCNWEVIGFIDDTEELKGKIINDIPVLGGFDYLKNFSGNLAVTIFDYPEKRKEIISKIKKINNKINFPNIISSYSILSKFIEWGEGCIVQLNNIITIDVKIGNFVFINCKTAIGHDVIIGDFTTIYVRVFIGGGVVIGERCLIGSGATILPRVKIGDGSIIGAGSLVNKDIPPKVVAAGVPAKIIRELK